MRNDAAVRGFAPSTRTASRRRGPALVVAASLITLAVAVGALSALALDPEPAAPVAGPTAAQQAAEQRAAIVARPHTFVSGATAVTVARADMARIVRVAGARVVVDGALLAQLLGPSFPDRPAVSARIETSADDAWVVPAENGRRLDAAETGRAMLSAPRSTTHVVRFIPVEPTLTTAEAEALGIDDVVSEFTTHYPAGQPRVQNIKRAAELLDGTVLSPGERFSLNEALGERTVARGFVSAPSIVNNTFVDSVGGGISQVATNLYNAAFFAGLELIEHQAHSLYIDRYPLGREATISWGGPELVFRNDWDASLLMRVVATDTRITVRFYSSTLGRRVTTETTAEEPTSRGFVVHYTRRVYENERLVRDEHFTTRYAG